MNRNSKKKDLNPDNSLPNKYRVFKWSFPRRTLFRLIFPIISNVINRGFNYESFGLEHLNKYPEGVPIILAGNHRSHLDALAVGASVLPPRGKRRYIATITPGGALEANPFFGLMRYLGAFPIDKSNPSLSLDYFFETLMHKLGILIFPQGGRMARTPLEDYQKFSEEGRSGVGRLVLRTNGTVPVIPFYIHGTAEALGIGSLLPRFGSYISVSFGKPIIFEKYSRKDGWIVNQEFYEESRNITNEIMAEIKKLCLKTEEPIFKVIESKIGLPIDEVQLSKSQSKKLRRKLVKWSKHKPEEYLDTF